MIEVKFEDSETLSSQLLESQSIEFDPELDKPVNVNFITRGVKICIGTSTFTVKTDIKFYYFSMQDEKRVFFLSDEKSVQWIPISNAVGIAIPDVGEILSKITGRYND